MPITPPRSRVESAEGSGIARSHWFQYISTLPRPMLEATGVLSTLDDGPAQWLSDEHRKAVANNAKETSELIGFWVTWHLAGGFDRLELWGWHRATIYRKIKRFRERFGAHPDDYAFDWIDLDLPKTWSDRLRAEL